MAYKQNSNPLKGASMHGSNHKNDGPSLAIMATLATIAGKLGLGKAAAAGAGKVIASTTAKAAASTGKAVAKKGLGKIAKKAGDALHIAKKQVGNKVSQGVDKVAKATGKSRAEIIEAAKSKALTTGTGAVTSGVEKISENKDIDVSGLKQEDKSKDESMSSYANPTGPSMNNTDALDPSNIKKSSGLKYAVDNFSAPISIKGVDVDAGNIVRGVLAGGKHIKDKKTRSNRIKEIVESKQNLKQSAKKAANASFMKKMAQDMRIQNLKG